MRCDPRASRPAFRARASLRPLTHWHARHCCLLPWPVRRRATHCVRPLAPQWVGRRGTVRPGQPRSSRYRCASRSSARISKPDRSCCGSHRSRRLASLRPIAMLLCSRCVRVQSPAATTAFSPAPFEPTTSSASDNCSPRPRPRPSARATRRTARPKDLRPCVNVRVAAAG